MSGPYAFSGVISVSTDAAVENERAFGLADRPHRVAMSVDTQLATASGTKAFTAAAVLALVAASRLSLHTRAREVLGADLPLIADDVTVDHLLTHRSGIGDYVDEDADVETALKVPVQQLQSTPDYLPALDGFAAKFAPGSRFSYCNSGYVVLALIAERVTGRPFADLLATHVWQPAGMSDTGFLRSDRLPGRAAIGYLDDGRSNVFALPVLGSGDGGAYTTVADLRRFWSALIGQRLLPAPLTTLMTQPSTTDTGHEFGYSRGLWLDARTGELVIEGCDHGASLRSVHDPGTGRTITVISNTSNGAFPIARAFAAITAAGREAHTSAWEG
jgi:CubicO group peptidase (beta-lactamase class C family)